MVEKILKASQIPRESKVLIDMMDNDGKTALYIAAERGLEKIVEALLGYDPKLNIK